MQSKYYLYISQTKVRMLAEQMPRGMCQGQRLDLAEFLVSAFTDSELRRLLLAVGGESLLSSVPSTGVSLSDLAFDAYRALAQRGLIDDELFRELARQRPARAEEIRDIQVLTDRDEWRHGRYDGLQAGDAGRLHPWVIQVVDWLEANCEVGSLAESRPYIRASMSMRFDAIEDRHQTALAFFGGESADARVALIGAVTSLVGAFEVHEAQSWHSPLYYLATFLLGRGYPESRELAKGHEIAMSLSGVALHLEFVAKVLLRDTADGSPRIVASPIYVAFAQ